MLLISYQSGWEMVLSGWSPEAVNNFKGFKPTINMAILTLAKGDRCVETEGDVEGLGTPWPRTDRRRRQEERTPIATEHSGEGPESAVIHEPNVRPASETAATMVKCCSDRRDVWLSFWKGTEVKGRFAWCFERLQITVVEKNVRDWAVEHAVGVQAFHISHISHSGRWTSTFDIEAGRHRRRRRR